MQKLLITFGTRPLAQRIAKLIQSQYDVKFASSEEVPSFLAANYSKIPTGINPTFAHELLKLCLDKQIDYLLPLGLSEVQSLSETKLLFEEYGIHVLSPDKSDLEDIFVLENPASTIELLICEKGKSIHSDKTLEFEVSGLLTVSDDGNDVALCTV